jgi:UDPglucose 6-dehydrogenase
MKIAVVGIGFVGLSNAIVLAQNNHVIAVDISEEKVKCVNRGISPITDLEGSELLNSFVLDGTIGGKLASRSLIATTDLGLACLDADYVIIATPTDYDEATNKFDTRSIESVISQISCDAMIVIKSTIPIGYVASLRLRFADKAIIFSPEFLREGRAVRDNLYPSRVIIGGKCDRARKFGKLLKQSAKAKDVPIIFSDSTEAEAIKLFANAYLAMRVAFFNELDTFACVKNLNAREIIDGVGADPRIGSGYNNPSFGYGGYCFPKDTKQLRENYREIPNNIVEAIVSSNETRKTFIADEILNKGISVLGIHRLIMKSGSDNFRCSSIYDVAKKVEERGVKVVVYEPEAVDSDLKDMTRIDSLDVFLSITDLIICNRWSNDLSGFESKVFSRDIFHTDI